jgi:hypothetical protein
MVRNAMFRRVELVARDDLDGLMALERAAADRTDPPREVLMTRSAWDEAIEAYYGDHDAVDMGPDARSPQLLTREAGTDEETGARVWRVRQTVHDPAGDHDWVVEAVADLDATDEVGELVMPTVAFRRL